MMMMTTELSGKKHFMMVLIRNGTKMVRLNTSLIMWIKNYKASQNLGTKMEYFNVNAIIMKVSLMVFTNFGSKMVL